MNALHVDTIISTSMAKSAGDKSMGNIDIVQRNFEFSFLPLLFKH